MNPIEDSRLEVLNRIQSRVLWLATRMVDAANRERVPIDGLKVGGHQASSASLATIMTCLWFQFLRAEDRVSVKPHAAPVFHAISYLLGELDRSYMTRLRAYEGLQAYPSRTKDPNVVDFSTGSVGLGAVAPLFAAVTRRYVDAHFGPRPSSRFISIIGDAELDEGNIWEAIADPVTTGLGNVLWIIDFNRQSLDRIVPGIRIHQWTSQFAAAGWHVQEVKYGSRLQDAFQGVNGSALRTWIDSMPNEQYQALIGQRGTKFRESFLDGAPVEVADWAQGIDDGELAELVCDLGGHDIEALLEAFARCDAVSDRPSVVFAYTIKGWGLPMAGDPRNHSALLNEEQINTLRDRVGLTDSTEWDRFDPASPEGILAAQRREILHRDPVSPSLNVDVPISSGEIDKDRMSTQEAFGRVLVDLSRNEVLSRYLVTTAPDVATSTNLAGFINRAGVFSPDEQRSWNTDSVVKWVEGPTGQHLELGISEMNLFLLLGQLGLSWDLSAQPLIPVGTLYDPFVCRGLDALIYSCYSGSRFVVAGTPSGITLAPEGGAHQSTITASIGLELPGVTIIEPTYAQSLDWLLCNAVMRIASGDSGPTTAGPSENGAYYFRLSTRPIDQTPFKKARERIGDAVLRRQVLAGAYRLWDAFEARPELQEDSRHVPVVHLMASGPVICETLEAASELADEGIAAHVIDVTSADRLYVAWQRTLRQSVRTATAPSLPGSLWSIFGDRAPIVTVHDAASHAMAWLGSALGVPCVPLGVDGFGQSGSIPDLYAAHDLDSGSIVNGALAALALDSR